MQNVLDVLRSGVDSVLMRLGRASVHDLTPDDVLVPDGFARRLGAGPADRPAPPAAARTESARDAVRA